MYRDAVLGVLISASVIMLLDFLLHILISRRRQSVAPRQASSLGYSASRVLVNLFGFLSFAAIGGSGFYSLLTGRRTMTGYGLMVHVGAAPAFAIGALLVALFWAHRNRFTAADWHRLRRPTGSMASGVASSYAVVLRKLFFWIAAALAAPATLSTILAMFPLFGPGRQDDLFEIHRYCALPLAAAGLFFAYFSLVAWLGRNSD